MTIQIAWKVCFESDAGDAECHITSSKLYQPSGDIQDESDTGLTPVRSANPEFANPL